MAESIQPTPSDADKLAQAEVKFAVNEAMHVINNSIVEKFPFLSELELKEQLKQVDETVTALARVIQKYLAPQADSNEISLSNVLKSILLKISNCKSGYDQTETDELLKNLHISSGLMSTINGESSPQISFLTHLQSQIKNLHRSLCDIDTRHHKNTSKQELSAPSMNIDSNLPPKVADTKKFSTTMEIEPAPIVERLVNEGGSDNTLSEIISDEFTQKKDEVISVINELNQEDQNKNFNKKDAI